MDRVTLLHGKSIILCCRRAVALFFQVHSCTYKMGHVNPTTPPFGGDLSFLWQECAKFDNSIASAIDMNGAPKFKVGHVT